MNANLVVALVLLPAASLGLPSTVSECSGPRYHALDFWLGTWTVTAGKEKFDGDNVIAKVQGGCAVRESWTDASGQTGESLFYFDATADRWKQVWVTAAGTFKEKTEVDAPPGAIRFQGTVHGANGAPALDRTTLTRSSDGHVHQLIEQSQDSGKTWQSWEGTYTRRAETCTTGEHHQLDFWLGEWDAVVKSRHAPDSEQWDEARGSNHVTLSDNGCTVNENFHSDGAPPWTGRSVSQFQPKLKKWRQVWVDDQNAWLAFTGGVEGKDVALYGEPQPVPGGSGQRQMRMVFTDIKPGSFHWRWEATLDGGKTWKPSMLIDYTRRASVSRDR